MARPRTIDDKVKYEVETLAGMFGVYGDELDKPVNNAGKPVVSATGPISNERAMNSYYKQRMGEVYGEKGLTALAKLDTDTLTRVNSKRQKTLTLGDYINYAGEIGVDISEYLSYRTPQNYQKLKESLEKKAKEDDAAATLLGVLRALEGEVNAVLNQKLVGTANNIAKKDALALDRARKAKPGTKERTAYDNLMGAEKAAKKAKEAKPKAQEAYGTLGLDGFADADYALAA